MRRVISQNDILTEFGHHLKQQHWLCSHQPPQQTVVSCRVESIDPTTINSPTTYPTQHLVQSKPTHHPPITHPQLNPNLQNQSPMSCRVNQANHRQPNPAPNHGNVILISAIHGFMCSAPVYSFPQFVFFFFYLLVFQGRPTCR